MLSKEAAQLIVECYARGYTYRSISDIFEADPHLSGNQLSGKDLVDMAIEKLEIDRQKLEDFQTKILELKAKLQDRIDAEHTLFFGTNDFISRLIKFDK